jgi:stage IV sporulation protein FB
MGWESRQYDDSLRDEGGGRVRAVFRRIFGDGENPLTWAVPLYRAWGIQVKIHIVFIIMIIARLIWSIPHDRIGPAFVAMGMGALFLLVLLHEYGHCFACRRVGGTADQILMWPLGGLASCAPPHEWRADLITTIGGPAVNAVLWPVFALVLWLILPAGTAAGALIFNPFDPGIAIGGLRLADGTTPLWLVGLWWSYYMNIVLLGLNVLLPMYPMDGGRIMHALLWRKMGHWKATSLSVNIGIGIAVVLFVVAITGNAILLAGLAAFGGIVCWIERRRLKMTGDPVLGEAGYDFSRGYLGMPGAERDEDDSYTSRAEEKRRKAEEEEQLELDRILAKIAESGMASLSPREKRWLEKVTLKRRAR